MKSRIVNLHYRDTVESDVYVSLGKRINLFEQVVDACSRFWRVCRA